MGPRNLMILFFSTVAVSLVILIIFFSMFFKDVDLEFNTRLPESAPDMGKYYGESDTSKAEGLFRSTINVPPEFHGSPKPADQTDTSEEDEAEEPTEAAQQAEPEVPVSDDQILDSDAQPEPPPAAAEPPAEENATYQVYMGGFATREDAEAAAARAVSAGVSPLIKQSGDTYTVQLGTFSSKANAEGLAAKAGAQVRKTN